MHYIRNMLGALIQYGWQGVDYWVANPLPFYRLIAG